MSILRSLCIKLQNIHVNASLSIKTYLCLRPDTERNDSRQEGREQPCMKSSVHVGRGYVVWVFGAKL